MGDSNADIIRKAYEDFSHGNIPVFFLAHSIPILRGTFLVMVRFLAAMQAMTRSERSFSARWNFQEACSASMCITSWRRAIASLSWLL